MKIIYYHTITGCYMQYSIYSIQYTNQCYLILLLFQQFSMYLHKLNTMIIRNKYE